MKSLPSNTFPEHAMTDDDQLIKQILAKNGDVRRETKRDAGTPRSPRVPKEDTPGHIDPHPERMVAVDPRILDLPPLD